MNGESGKSGSSGARIASEAVALLEEIRQLMVLKGENPFKIRAIENAEAILVGQTDLVERAKAGTLMDLPGIGKGISAILTEFLLQGSCSVRDELAAALPPGLLELTQVPGLGPKKALLIIEELGISNLRELEYACRENRLLKLKGFGAKAQQKIHEGIQFLNANTGWQRLSEAFVLAEPLLRELLQASRTRVSETGALRRRMEVLSELEFLVEQAPGVKAQASRIQEVVDRFAKESRGGLPVRIHYCPADIHGYELARTTGTEAHWKALEKFFGASKGLACAPRCLTEELFYQSLGLPWIPPEMRETGAEVQFASAGELSDILAWNGVRGAFHNHTTRSDGVATLEEMVVAARALGHEYIGISDHSQSAFYAQGLKKEDLLEQEKEVRRIQEKHPDIRIFWGIESDILADGSLDYEPAILKRFDFVVASVHSRFQMDKDAMTERIIKAIRNPYTRFLGHATGRLLLGRKGYELDMEKVIAEAARQGVAIEINANPARLDIDWRWGPQLREHGTFTSINPDAHDTAGLKDVVYGVAMARKAMLPASLVVNSRSTEAVEKWLKRA